MANYQTILDSYTEPTTLTLAARAWGRGEASLELAEACRELADTLANETTDGGMLRSGVQSSERIRAAEREVEAIWERESEAGKKQHHTVRVVTWQAPDGAKIDVCTKCEKRLKAEGTWPRNASGEYCTVHHGEHRGLCTYDTSEDEPEDKLSGWADSESFGDAVQRRPACGRGKGWIYRHWDGGLACYRDGLGPYATHTIRW